MLARDQFDGSKEPFEGDRMVVVRSLPEGAQVTRATITLEPVAPPNGVLFEEQIIFSNGVSDRWGATKVKQAGATGTAVPPGFVEVDFHARRTLGKVAGSNLKVANQNATLQVDIGGLFVPIDQVGAMFFPQDPKPLFQVPSAEGGSLPSIATNKFKLTVEGLQQDIAPDIIEVTVRSAPSNITLRLGQQPPFFARPGELAQEQACPDFSQILQNFLADAQAKDGFYEIPLTVHSDTIARLTVTVEVEYVQEQNLLPGGLQQATLTFDHSSAAQPGSATLQVSVPAGARVIPGRTTARVRGSFQNSRIVYGPTGDLQPAARILVNSSRAQAAPLFFLADLAASAVDLLLAAKSRTAQLALNVVKDVDGKPWTESILPEPARLAIDSEIAGSPTWVNVVLPVEIQFKAGVRYWLVLQSLQGEAAWYVSPQRAVATAASNGIWTAGAGVAADIASSGPIGVQYTDTGGLAWRQEVVPEASGPLAAFVHLRQPAAVFQVPIALQVGEGETARRVSLDRFQPLGRVDFSLDFDEVAESINNAISSASATSPPVGEHLLNNEFDVWRRVGDLPRRGRTEVPAGSGAPEALAVSPDGKELYIVNITEEGDGGEVQLAFVDTACHELQQPEISLGMESFYGMAVSPDGHRAFVLQDEKMTWVDLEARSLVGIATELEQVSDAFGKPIFSADGGQLYVLQTPSRTSQILIFDTDLLETEFRGEKKVERAVTDVIRLDFPWRAVLQVLSPDGSRLYILAEDFSFGVDTAGAASGPAAAILIYLLDSKSWAPPIRLNPGGAYHMALNPEGSRIIVASESVQEVTLFETRGGQRLGSIALIDQGAPGAVAIDRDGRLAFIALSIERVVAFDISRLAQGFLEPEIIVQQRPSDLAISPSGEWLYIADKSFWEDAEENRHYSLTAVALGAMVPEEWTLTSGETFPFCLSQPSRRIAVLGSFGGKESETDVRTPTAISQVVPVAGGIHYILTFTGASTTPEALAEVFWYGEQCSFQQVNRLPFETIVENDSGAASISLPTSQLDMVSPPGASLAEVRFIVPGNAIAGIDNVSLRATADALSNSNLQAQSSGRLSGWELVPPGAVGLTVVASSSSVTIRNGGSSVCSLQQVVPFEAEIAFNLRFGGQGLAGNPQVQLAWLGANHERLGAPLEIPLSVSGSDHEERLGSSLPGTQYALLSLVLPAGASLSVQRISLDVVEVVSVPISFVAQAPGDLTISEVRVAYEMVPSPPPGVPSQGLCPATPPGGQPGSGRHGHYYCPNCGEEDELCDEEPSITPGGAPALEGHCCHCGARITLPGGAPRIGARTGQTVSAGGNRPPLVIPRAAATRQPGTRLGIPTERFTTPRPAPPVVPQSQHVTAGASKLVGVGGLTEEQAERLAAAKINTLAKLARAKPEIVASTLGISQDAATVILREAKKLHRPASKKKKE